MKKIFKLNFILIFIMTLFLVACNKSESNPRKTVKDLNCIYETEFGGVYFSLTIDDFNDLGYQYGDSLKIELSNGVTLKDIPYYSGYYCLVGEELLVAYKGYPYIRFGINCGEDAWVKYNVKEDTLATISLYKKLKYKDIEKISNIVYEDDLTKYDTVEEFSNFRNVTVGNIKENVLFRGASPCDNKRKRAHSVDTLLEKSSIQFILNLADTDDKIKEYMASDDFDSPYFEKLYNKNCLFLGSLNESDNVTPMSMNMNYKSAEFREKVAKGLKNMSIKQGPYYVHCLEGKDRTGFVLMIIEGLMGATYKEIVDDYMLTYDNYYHINEKDDKRRYNLIKERNIDMMLEFISNNNSFYDDLTFENAIKEYLINGGMTEEDINNLISKLAK